MKPVQIYGLRRCSTCVKARKWLDTKGVAHTFIDYRDEPISPALLTAWAEKHGWSVVVNKASASWRSLSDEQKQANAAEQWLALIAEHPTLVKRPVLVQGADVVFGFSEATYNDRFK